MAKHTDTGKKGENIAAQHIVSQGYSILERNWRYKYWEIDIIASKKDTLVFVEVKTRSTDKFGYPEESFGRDKMTRLKKAASEYLERNPNWKKIRFDVVSVILAGDSVKEIFLIEDVFF